jgi:hypothetical protein
MEKVSQTFGLLLYFCKNSDQSRPMGENSPNQVNLTKLKK